MIEFSDFCRGRIARLAYEFPLPHKNLRRGRVTLGGSIGLILLFASPVFAQATSQSGAASSPPTAKPAASAPVIKKVAVADRWTYEKRDEISGEVKGTFTQVVTDISPKEISVRVKSLGKPGVGFLTYDHSWNLISNGHWRVSPNDGTGVKLPLSIGKRWRFHSNQVLAGKNVYLRSVGTSKVVARTTLTTQAGTFDTYEIDTSFTTRNSNDPTKHFSFLMKTWYAPSIDHWVKRERTMRFQGQLRQHYSLELVEYEQGE
ncbi:MAG: hypothetical protein EPN75_09030 [Beijerinckiaceae bacterium]|nr:MAG: hypothetical protein EPN75_09030 [Beijerinckiaceae bacterium]